MVAAAAAEEVGDGQRLSQMHVYLHLLPVSPDKPNVMHIKF